MTVNTALVFIHPGAPSAAPSRSDIGSDKVKVPLFLPIMNRFYKQLAVRAQAKWQALVSAG